MNEQGNSRFHRISIVGAGAWGTALAATVRRAGRNVTIWAREQQVVADINRHHENRDFLPGVRLDPAIIATGDLEQAARADAVLLVCPAQYLRPIGRQLAAHLPQDVPVVICAKGVEKGTLSLMGDVAAEVLPHAPVAILSGPTFAREVAENRPTAITLACADHDLGEELVGALGHARFRPYLSSDVIGAQIGGAVKNVLAIACGIANGQELGANASAALITRGLAEVVRLGLALGARQDTLMGLSGLGDLVLTCSSPKSRNMSLGLELGKGRKLADVLGERNSVTEGVFTAEAVTELAARENIEMPIAEAVDRILTGQGDANSEMEQLMTRPFRREDEVKGHT